MLSVTDIVVIAILVVLFGAVFAYIHRSKKRGIKCIGCPYAESCSGGCSHVPDTPHTAQKSDAAASEKEDCHTNNP